MSSSSENKPSSSSSSSPSMLKLFGFSLTAGDDVGSRKIQCSFCHREFQNLQALGGHQNAHRRERQMSRLAQFEYMRLRQSNHIFQAVTPLVIPQGASSISVFGGATQFSTVPESSQKLPVVEPPGTLPVSVVQVPVIGVDDNNIDLELRLGTTSNESGK